MSGHGRAPYPVADGCNTTRRMRLRSYRERAPECDMSDSEPAANATEAARRASSSRQTPRPFFATSNASQARATTPLNPAAATFVPSFAVRPTHAIRPDHRRGRDSATGSPTPSDFAPPPLTTAHAAATDHLDHGHQFEATGLESEPEALQDLLAHIDSDDLLGTDNLLDLWQPLQAETSSTQPPRTPPSIEELHLHRMASKFIRSTPGASSKRSRDRFESTDNSSTSRMLRDRDAVAAIQYRNVAPDPKANDIWPNFRNASKMPAQYSVLGKDLNKDGLPHEASRTKRRVPNLGKKKLNKDKQPSSVGRPKWDLPVELVEIIACYLNRDDIKSLRLVSQELNHYVSQVIFKTVVVPFNTEIYGMLAQGQKPDLKGKKRAGPDKPVFPWRNANGDQVYNGHGLDVFKGFGQHIVRFGMSFEVNEESLSQPPVKSLTEKKTSFWGNYDWPFDEYRRFDAVAGLETAADETPRMKLAFSELTKVKELALSIDSGLGWLNGPDRSIRARILRRPPAVFGTLKDIPDRRAQAQQELWRHIETCHQLAGDDIKSATLYRIDAARSISETEEVQTLAEEQPVMPYLDAQTLHEAPSHDTTEMPLPASFDDPDVLDRFILAPCSSSSGILFSSTRPPSDAAQLMSPVIPANLTKAQKEWLLETDWAQRAFISSYMLSIIDNPVTFALVHTMNISRLSDRYLVLLNRADFWATLPNLKNLTLMVIPDWRNVYKDEAGFVNTLKINPLDGLDPFLDLLRNHVATRSSIRNLTIGWAGGGEHAEGLHARNRHLMPAPIMPLVFRNDSFVSYEMIAETNPVRLQAALLAFPYVERLVLQNCWITPNMLLQFTKIHDDLQLKHLVLQSVSLTAILRPLGHGNGNGIGNPAAQPLALVAAPAAPLNALAVLGGAAHGLNNNVGGQAGSQAQPGTNNIQLLNWFAQFLGVSMLNLQTMMVNAASIQHQNALNALTAQVQVQLGQLNVLRQQHYQIQQRTAAQRDALNQAQDQQSALNHRQAPNLTQNHQQDHDQTQHQQLVAQHNQVLTQFQLQVAGLGNQIQTLHQQIVAGAPAAPQPSTQTPANPPTLLHTAPREGSWAWLLDQISPSANLSTYDSPHSLADSTRTTSLESIEFVSCGYARLPHASLTQTGLDRWNRTTTWRSAPSLVKRNNALLLAMLPAKWPHLGEIVQDPEPLEFAVLDAAWDLKVSVGWDEGEAQACEFDGYLRGGTGRFGGVVRRGDGVRGEE